MKKKGFTLVELLATIIVLGILVGIALYVTTSIIGRSKEKSYQVTINEIEKNTSNYLAENSNRLFYLENTEKGYEYQCITVENLVDYGYLGNDVTNSNVSNDSKAELGDYIYIERDINTKAITKTIYTKTNPEYINICTKAVNASGNINFTANPSFNEWSKYKDVTITYRLKNLNDQRTLNDYNFNHSYSGQSTYDDSKDTLEKNTKTQLVRVTSNGDLTANIKLKDESIASSKKEIDRIDIVGPVVALDEFKENKVHGQVTLPLKVTDFGIGVDYSTFTTEDITVKVGDTEIEDINLEHDSNEKYKLTINNNTVAGNIKIYIGKDKVFDKLENGNLDIEIDTGIVFENVYTITYDANGGSGAPGATTYTYSPDAMVNLTTAKPTRDYYTFLGWHTSSTATSAKYASGASYPRKTTKNVTLYAVWRKNKIITRYNINGGSFKDCSKEKALTIKNGYVAYSGNIDAWKYNFDMSTIDLANVVTCAFFMTTKSGQRAAADKEWCTRPNGTGSCFNDHVRLDFQKTIAANCNARYGDCTITLYAHWVNGRNPWSTACCT